MVLRIGDLRFVMDLVVIELSCVYVLKVAGLLQVSDGAGR